MDDQDKLSAMFAVMEEQQAAVQSAIAGLVQERKAMVAVLDAIKTPLERSKKPQKTPQHVQWWNLSAKRRKRL